MQTVVARRTVDWLLAGTNPPVRFLTLTRLLDRPPGSRDVRSARAALGDYGPTRRILRHRARFWYDGADLYRKHGGGYWQLIFLGEYLAPPRLAGVAGGVERILGLLETIPADRPLWGIHCLNANLLRAMVTLGFGDDRRVRAGLDLVADEVLASDGIPCAIIDWSVYPTCAMALPKVLLALTALPAGERSRKVRRAVRLCRDRLIAQRVHHYVSPVAAGWNDGAWKVTGLAEPQTMEEVRDPTRRRRILAGRDVYVRDSGGLGRLGPKTSWEWFQFPQSYDSDLLEAMRALVQAGAPKRAPELDGAVEAILAKRRPDGRWNLDGSLNETMLAKVERTGQPSRWITFYALWVLRHFRGLAIA